jgi:ParB-like chromosome segregation protein Spo0J
MEARRQGVPRGMELLPVVLYEIGGSYFVLDGNHRVRVARYHGVEMIDAEVKVFSARSSIKRPEASAA